jgi:hypothetical protein
LLPLKQRLAFPAFQSRNYRLFFLGQGLSLIGNWITMVAVVWSVYRLTQSPVLLGIVDEMRGRVMSIYIMSFLGMISFGNLFQGALIKFIGAPHTVAINGIICILVSLLFARQLPRLQQMV